MNGTYVEDGTAGGKVAFKLAGRSYYLVWEEMSQYWQLSDWKEMGMPYYYSSAGGDLPPTTGWTAAMGTPPAPTVAQV